MAIYGNKSTSVAMLLVAGLCLASSALKVAGHEHEMKSDHENHGDDCPHSNAAPAKPVPDVGPRSRRQVTYMQPQAANNQAPGSSNPLGQLGDFSSQVDRLNAPLKMIGQLFNTNKQQQQPPQTYEQTIPAAINQAAAQQQAGFPPVTGFMNSITELIRPARDSAMNLASQAQQNAQQTAQQAIQQTVAAQQNAQSGIAAALSEISQGLQRIAANNPSLVPDVKSLYSSVSSKLSSASQSVAQANPLQQTSSNIVPATNSQQLADNLAKVAFPGLQTPVV